LTFTRALAVLAAANLVAAFALATLLQPMLPLGQLITMTNAHALYVAKDFLLAHTSQWIWFHLFLPVLLRPCWLLPASAGIVLAGGATTLASRKGVPRSHRRRS
jgi:hypothetical protein